ncbi:MAG: dicarboxylate/amino acid:cation symporter, partial [Gammaproteobacteria bacterium]
LGVFVGNQWNSIGLILKQPGDLYLAMITMSVLPIMSTAIITGLARMLRSGVASEYLSRLVFLFVLTALVGSALGLAVALIGQPGVSLGGASEAFLGKLLMRENELTSNMSDQGLWGIITELVPSNIFGAFSEGQILGVIFVSALIGAAVGVSKSESAQRFLETAEGLNESFVRILAWVLYGLPVGLFCMLAGQVAALGIEAIFALGKFVMLFYLAGIILCVFYFLVIRVSTGVSSGRILSAIRDPLFVSFSAASSIAPIPIALEKMRNELKQPEDVCDVVIPLSVAMNRHSYAMLFAFTAIFLAQLFGKTLDLGQIMLVLFTSAMVGTATAGRLAAAGVMLVYILAPIGVPVSVGITIFVTVGAIIDPIVQMCILFGGCANAAVIARSGKKAGNEAPEPAANNNPAAASSTTN